MRLSILFWGLSINCLVNAATYVVSPSGTYKSASAVASLLQDGDSVLIEGGVYTNQPQVYFTKNNLYISGINGHPRIEGGVKLASNRNGKALFVISGSNCLVENIEFANAAVPDLNGAGIRQEGCDLRVQYCRFIGNQMGILGGNYSDCTVTIEHCIFTNNGSPSNPGFQHNVYINHIDTLIFQYNYTVNAIAQGHELKSRAHFNLIRYNYIGNLSSNDSRNIDLPNGGTTVLVGNIIEQSESSVNSNLVGYGLEGLTNKKPHNLWIVNNTFVNRKSKGSFVQVKANTDSIYLKNNIMVGQKTGGLLIGSPTFLDSSNNIIDDQISTAGFENAALGNYHLAKTSVCINRGTSDLPSVRYALNPAKEYSDTASFGERKVFGVIDIGAYEFSGRASSHELTQPTLLVYPNPVTNLILNFDDGSVTPFQLLTLDGKSIFDGNFVDGRTTLSGVRPGLYILILEETRQLLVVQ